MNPGEQLLKQHTIKHQIGQGGFGTVYYAIHNETGEERAIKIDSQTIGDALKEAKFLRLLQGEEGFPQLYGQGCVEKYSFMILELLGPDLRKLMLYNHGKFPIPLAVEVCEQILKRIMIIHKHGYVYRDLCPQQFLLKESTNKIYIVDFGFTMKYKESNNEHVRYKENQTTYGKIAFVSPNSHRGIFQSRRDDMCSFAFLAIYLIKGQLPWQDKEYMKKFIGKNGVMNAKLDTSPEYICEGLPKEYIDILSYCQSLTFSEKPNYHYIHTMLRRIKKQFGAPDPFSLIVLKQDTVGFRPTNNSQLSGMHLFPQFMNANNKRNLSVPPQKRVVSHLRNVLLPSNNVSPASGQQLSGESNAQMPFPRSPAKAYTRQPDHLTIDRPQYVRDNSPNRRLLSMSSIPSRPNINRSNSPGNFYLNADLSGSYRSLQLIEDPPLTIPPPSNIRQLSVPEMLSNIQDDEATPVHNYPEIRDRDIFAQKLSEIKSKCRGQ